MTSAADPPRRPSLPDDRSRLLEAVLAVRRATAGLASRLSDEDLGVQSMPDASPAKWHLAHTTWFFETVVLQAHDPGYRVFDPAWARLFNSYYESLGPRHPRPRRGLLTRPSAAEVRRYRQHVDDALAGLAARCDADTWRAAAPLLVLGLNHEQQHQELLLTDILHAFSLHPLQPAVFEAPPAPAVAAPGGWFEVAGGEHEIGHAGAAVGADPLAGFAFDNEGPRHRVLLQPFALAARPVTCGEFQAFIDDGGYRRPALWLSDGWALVQQEGWTAPVYWRGEGVFGLAGLQPRSPDEPVSQLSLYEAAAYAEWAGARLPTEFEWEAAARADGADRRPAAGLDPLAPEPHPRAGLAGPGYGALAGLFGCVWQWTRSSYDPYPRFRPLPGAVGEYNGKFMVGQAVLRGGSCATPAGHGRVTYRNFFPPGARWQFSGLRLARDLD